MKISHFFAVLLLACSLPTARGAESAEQLQKKLLAAQLEIESLKGKIAAMQSQVEKAREAKILPLRPTGGAGARVEHPIVTSYELASYAQTDPATVKNLLKGKVVSITGAVERFNEGLGRGFKLFLNTSGSTMQVGGSFHAMSSTKSVYTREDGAELVIDDEKRGPNTFAALNDKIVLSGFFSSVSRRQVLLSDCVLQKQ